MLPVLSDIVQFVPMDNDISNFARVHLLEFNNYVIVVYCQPSYEDAENELVLGFLTDFCMAGRFC